MEIIQIEPTEIKIANGLDRFRQDMGDIEELSKSIKRTRQILPIIINRQYELIDGGRRLAACILAGIQVKAVFEDVVDPKEMRELELEANLHRKDYTPAEYALAVEELHNFKREQYGATTPGAEGGHTLEDTAKLIGKTKGSVINQLQMAEMIKAFPQLREAKKASEIKKAYKGLEKIAAAMTGIQEYEKKVKSKEALFTLHNVDAIDHMTTVPDNSINILLTDPLYGIEHDKIGIAVGGRTGGKSAQGIDFDDDKYKALASYYFLAKESFRFTTFDAHGYIFHAEEHFNYLRDIFMEIGWRVYIKPIIWIKRSTGQCNVPTAWPSDCYEQIMYIRKDDSRIIKQGMPNWIECPPVNSSEKIHKYEKPVPLLDNLLERVSLPGQTLYDPFMGSASSIEAGVRQKLFSIGVDNSTEAYAVALQRMSKLGEK
jgi:ParB/RepB/Spo0J family partition protein